MMIRVASSSILTSLDGKPALLLARRDSRSDYADHWEGPGGKAHDGETFEEALRREIREELGTEINIHGLIGEARLEPPVTKSPLLLRMYGCTNAGGVMRPLAAAELRAFLPEEVPGLKLMPGNRILLREVLRWIRTGP